MNDSNSKLTKDGNGPIEQRKEFGLTSLSIDNRISVLVMIGLIVLFGIQSYVNLPKESAPDITIPTVLVITTYPGVAPEDMETLVTRPLEDELSNISDIKEMRSTTAQGYSNITLEFNADVNIENALQQVREKVDLAKPELPEEAEDPVIEEINFSELPIMQVNISGQYGMVKLKNVAEDLQDRIERIPSVLEANLSGGREREVKVSVNLAQLKYYDLTFSDIITAIQEENVTIPGGEIEVGEKKFLLRIPGRYESIEPIEDIVVASPNDQPVYIRDIAEVSFGFEDRETYAQLENDPVISLAIVKRSGANIIKTAEAVKEIIAEQQPTLPPTTEIAITSDMTQNIRSMVSSLENNIIAGLILVIAILLFFLGVRNASFVGVAVPMSMFLSFIIFSMLGMSMNMIVLFSLILALGMLVDNSIVAVENIYRYIEQGYDNFTAAKKATGEIAVPIISGTLTTLAAFIPLLFWPGIVGEFMFYLPLTLIITLTSSLFVALVINPVLCALFMNLETDEETRGPSMTRKGKITIAAAAGAFLLIALIIDFATWSILLIAAGLLWLLYHYALKPAADWWQRDGLERVLVKYEKALGWSLDHGKTVMGIAVAVLVSSFILFGIFNAGVEFFPEDIPPQQVFIQVEAPAGSTVEFTKSVIDSLEQNIPSIPHRTDIQTYLSTAGSAIAANPMMGAGNTSNKGTIVIDFVDYQRQEASAFETVQYIRNNFGDDITGAEVTVEEPQQGPPTGLPVSLEISGNDMRRLKDIANEIIRILQNNTVYSKLDGLETNLPDARPEIRIDVDRQKAALYGLSTREIGQTIRAAISGVDASEYRIGKEEYDITVRLQEQFRNNLSTLQSITVMDEGRAIPLSSVADWELSEGLGAIKHIDQERVITVQADVRSNYNANAVLEQVQQILQPYLQNQLPESYNYNYTGQQQEQQEAADFLTIAFLVALFLITFILVTQFNSLFKPLIIVSSVIMSTAGVLFGLIVFRMPFVIIMTGIGVIALAGVVVNNAIVLIDYIDILRTRDDMPLKEALVKGGLVRFRPVILTALTTVLGLIPLAIGLNLDFIMLISEPVEFFSNLSLYLYWGGPQAAWWAPMAIAVIVGLLFATILTLILVPVLYYMFENGRRDVNRYLFGTANPDLIIDHDTTNGESEIKEKEVLSS